MGLLGNLFGSKNNSGKKVDDLPWIVLSSIEQIEEIKDKSKERPQLIFKHSTTCGISRMVLNMFEQGYSLNGEQADLYFLDLHAHRDVSNKVSEMFGVLHQSPQLLVVKNGTVTFHTSHGAIADTDLNSVV